MRNLLYKSALVASTHTKTLKAFAERLRETGTPHKAVLIAVAHKPLTIASAIMAKNQLWQAKLIQLLDFQKPCVVILKVRSTLCPKQNAQTR